MYDFSATTLITLHNIEMCIYRAHQKICWKYEKVVFGYCNPVAATRVSCSPDVLQLDGPRIQSLCLQQGLLQTFFFDNSAGRALACFMNRDDAISARATLGTFPFADGLQPLCCADIVTSDAVKNLLSSGHWTQLSTAAGLSSVAPPSAKGRGASTWSAADGV